MTKKGIPKLLHELETRQLSPEEARIVELLVKECLSAPQVAEKLRRSVKTIQMHRANIHRKLGIHNIQQLARYYYTTDRVFG